MQGLTMTSRGPKVTPSKALVRATYQLLMADRAMVVLLFVGGVASAAVLGGILFPAWFVGHVTPTPSGGLAGFAVYAAALWASSVISELVTGAVVAAAVIRAEGGNPTVRDALAVAWSRRWPLMAWAAVSTVVGLGMAVLERFGVAGLLVRVFTGVGWAAATLFAVPVVITEGTMPLATVRRSVGTLTATFGPSLRSNVRLSAPWVVAEAVSLVATIAAVVTMLVGVHDHDLRVALSGGAVAAIAGIGFGFAAITRSALSAYLNTLLYRYAANQPIHGIDHRDLPPLPA